ncbi:GTP cyclohydrolase FolE2 [Pseudomonas sp. ZM23]|uniref:GTP cyclohydrolase FolE2 n=1 Tax=Pseudomonas triclosanedens TaxID=2961893 RepID=A0ABY6ZYE4_9PSED|nr:GTP cyclohydrolase FolE2 [Pseudomonas triclosanedens]MCP8462694.1 GTP cyclohydrolase FolE2 [Pseudomonas triclosanedens]MCP8468313.1 GTP cyclohydrolase FolE2 [Pseudomonas triclosanedens]MCP8475072.1 GTP cyclohydrolase FolE2 [Pseudomonas triclosanedens]WAI49881.1 GTP cyclohydrolase FolE2 [Pseudomonas triclosanedens]
MTIFLPDIARQTSALPITLDWVGMQGIAVPLLIAGMQTPALADAGVSLDDAGARGIHMSRLYLALEMLEGEPLSADLLRRLLRQFLDSHTGLSLRASLALRFELLLRRPALVSPLSGWKRYPCELHASLDHDGLRLELELRLPYSSTCPCSAALARQLIQERFDEDFAHRPLHADEVRAWLGSSQGIVATPHSQRSDAHLRLRIDPQLAELPLVALLDLAESALGTAVQTAVKRADEQAFALANGQNLMFCEDAARRLHQALLGHEAVQEFELQVTHAESLHAHDAVARSRWRRS